jgi:HEPN domain-containing protein
MSSIVDQLLIRLENDQITEEGLSAAVGTLGELQREAEHLKLTSAVSQLKRIYEHLFKDRKPLRQVRQLVLDLYLRILDELENQVFLVLPPEAVPFYRQPYPVFGKDVDDGFPLASEDISEAAKCLSLNRATACVFHLMRAMEAAVQTLCTKLEIANPEREWGKLLSDIAKAIEKMPRDAVRNKWSETHTHLYHVKQAWRNDTMHPKQTYTPDEAKAIFEAVKVFMGGLASLL